MVLRMIADTDPGLDFAMLSKILIYISQTFLQILKKPKTVIQKVSVFYMKKCLKRIFCFEFFFIKAQL